MKKGIFYLFLVSSLLFSPVQARPESIFYPSEKSENSGSRIKEVKENYNELERRILGYADVLKNPIGEIKYEKMKDYLLLVSSTEVAGESTIQEKEGAFRVRVIKPGKYSGINVRYHPNDNESAIVAIKLKAKTNQLESATFLIKENYNELERRILGYADVLKNPIGEIKYEKMKDYLMLVSSTEVAGESAIQEKEGTFRVRVIKPGKYSGINVRYHPRNNESAIVVIKLKAKTNQLESATFLRKENGEKKEQRVVTHKGKGIYKIVDSVFENSEEKELLGRMVTKFDFEPDTYADLCKQYLLNYQNRATDAEQAGR